MKKVLLFLILVLVVLGIGVVLMVDSAAKAAVERGGTYALGVDTKLDKASIGLISGEFGLEGLRVKNPPGFDGDHFLVLDHGGLALTLASLNEDVIQIPLIELSGLTLDMDRNSDGTNYDAILENLERVGGGDDDDGSVPSEEEQESEGKALNIGQIVIRDVTASIKILPIGGEASRVDVTIPELIIDEASNLTVAETYSLVIQALMGAVIQHGSGLLPSDVLNDLGQQLEGLGGLSASVLDQLGLGSGTGKQLEDAGKNLTEGLKGLFDKD